MQQEFQNGSVVTVYCTWLCLIELLPLDSGIPPNGDFDYVIPIDSSGQWGTYWVHAHASVSPIVNLRRRFLMDTVYDRDNTWMGCGHRLSSTLQTKPMLMMKNSQSFLEIGITSNTPTS